MTDKRLKELAAAFRMLSHHQVLEQPPSLEEVSELAQSVIDLTLAVSLFRERLETWGEWDEGCFYYNKVAASELQEALHLANKLLGRP